MQKSSYKPRIGIFGGSFNPPTIAHFQIALEIVNLRYVDEAWIVPCGDRLDKVVDVDRFARYRMCELLLKEISNESVPIKLNDLEVKNGAALSTYTLMKRFMTDYPDKEFFFVMGSDLVEGLESWVNGKQFKQEINFLIFLRMGYSLNKAYLPKNYILIETTFVGSSSSEVRKRIHNYVVREKLENKDDDKFSEGSKGLKYFSNDEWRLKRRNENLDKFHHMYLGVYGIVSLKTIEYIKEKKLYHPKL